MQSVQQNILVAHSVTAPTLFGVMQQGSFNAAESGDLFEIFKTTYVSTRQKRIEWMLNYMAELGGYVGTVKLVDVLPLTLDNGTTIEPVVAVNPTDVTVAPVDATVDVAKSALNGSQIASLIDVAAQINAGILSQDSALNIILSSFPSIDERQARRIVGLPVNAFKMCKNDHEISVFEEFGESQDDYIVLGNIPIEWNTPHQEIMKRHDQLFEKIGEITLTPGGSGK
jgi:hypothetical protein